MQTNNWLNIARGTTDPGYWVYNLNHVSDWNWFEIILTAKVYSSYELNTLGPLCLWQCFFYISHLHPFTFFFTNTSAISTIFPQYVQNIREILQLWVKPCWQQVATMNHWQTDKGRSFIRDVWRISKNCTKAFKHKYKSKVFVSHF